MRYLEKVGITQGGAPGLPGQGGRFRRPRFLAALSAIRRYELELGRLLLERVTAIKGLTVHGITDPTRGAERCPTVAFTLDGHEPAAITRSLGERGIYVRSGDHYAYELHRALGLSDSGGTVRVSLGHYNTPEEIDRLGEALEVLAGA